MDIKKILKEMIEKSSEITLAYGGEVSVFHPDTDKVKILDGYIKITGEDYFVYIDISSIYAIKGEQK